MDNPSTLCHAALNVLLEPDPMTKVRLSETYGAMWKSGEICAIGDETIERAPKRPARPAKPELIEPAKMPRRSAGEKGRVVLLHAIAHIELNAIDLAWDIILRFTSDGLPKEFYDDWVMVAIDEARHFKMLNDRMGELGAAYGDFPAHDGLWQAASKTADDILARLALVPMVLEARGLDTAPSSSIKLRAGGDDKTASIMEQIAEEEISHVGAGVRWFEHICKIREIEPISHFHGLVKSRFKGDLKPPFAHDLRARAGMDTRYYDHVS